MKILTVAFMLLFNYLDTLPKLYVGKAKIFFFFLYTSQPSLRGLLAKGRD